MAELLFDGKIEKDEQDLLGAKNLADFVVKK